MGTARLIDSTTGSVLPVVRSLFTPRIWKAMILAAYPFFLVSSTYFEALERAGTIGAFLADTLFLPTLVAYAVLVFILRKRAI